MFGDVKFVHLIILFYWIFVKCVKPKCLKKYRKKTNKNLNYSNNKKYNKNKNIKKKFYYVKNQNVIHKMI